MFVMACSDRMLILITIGNTEQTLNGVSEKLIDYIAFPSQSLKQCSIANLDSILPRSPLFKMLKIF